MNKHNNIEYNTFTDNMLIDRLAYYKIVTSLKFNDPIWENLNHTDRVSISGADVDAYYSGNSTQMLAWFVRDMTDPQGYGNSTGSYYSSNSITNMSVTFSGFPEHTPIRLRWYDSWTGDEIGTSVTFSNTSTNTTAPGFNRDIVAVLKPE